MPTMTLSGMTEANSALTDLNARKRVIQIDLSQPQRDLYGSL